MAEAEQAPGDDVTYVDVEVSDSDNPDFDEAFVDRLLAADDDAPWRH